MIEEAKGFPDCVSPVVRLHQTHPTSTGDARPGHRGYMGLNALQKVVLSNYGVGEAMVPFLPPVVAADESVFKHEAPNIGDQFFMDRGRRYDSDGRAGETLAPLEKTGGLPVNISPTCRCA